MFNKVYYKIISNYEDDFNEEQITNLYLLTLFIVAFSMFYLLYGYIFYLVEANELAYTNFGIGIMYLICLYIGIIKPKTELSQSLITISMCFYCAIMSYYLGFDKASFIQLIPLFFALFTFSTLSKRSIVLLTICIILSYLAILYFRFFTIAIYADRFNYIEAVNMALAFLFLAFIIYAKTISLRLVAAYKKKLENEVNTDFLTGLFNRHYMLDIFKNEKSYNDSFIVMLDIDFFKKINDIYGHLAGDYVLKTVAEIMSSHFRDQDYISRWGGEEFLLYIKNIKSFDLNNKLNDLKQKIANNAFDFDNNNINITVTFGVKKIDQSISINKNIAYADVALYYGKDNGRNQIVYYDDILNIKD